MKVVGTKLDNSDYERFEKACLNEGISKSEALRDLVKQYCKVCEDNKAYSQDLEQEVTPKPTVTLIEDNKPIPVMTNARVISN